MATASAPALRPATAKDEPFLFRLYASTRAEEMAATGWSDAQRNAFLRSQFAARQSSYLATFPRAEHAIILLGRTAVGAIIVNRAGHEIRIVDIALAPEHRSRGTGGRVLRDLQLEARAARLPLRLQVLKTNPAARLYARIGFAPTSDNGLYLKMEWRDGLA